MSDDQNNNPNNPNEPVFIDPLESVDEDIGVLTHKFSNLSLIDDDEGFVQVVDVDDIFDDDL